MGDVIEFKVRKRKKAKPIEFHLGLEPDQDEDEDTPHVYSFVVPKQAVMLMPLMEGGDDDENGMAMAKATMDWLGTGLSEEDNHRILRRLKDNNDGLDVSDISDIVVRLSEEVAERPTT